MDIKLSEEYILRINSTYQTIELLEYKRECNMFDGSVDYVLVPVKELSKREIILLGYILDCATYIDDVGEPLLYEVQKRLEDIQDLLNNFSFTNIN